MRCQSAAGQVERDRGEADGAIGGCGTGTGRGGRACGQVQASILIYTYLMSSVAELGQKHW